MRIIFLGTPQFSVPTLERLIDSKHEIVAVITQPDKKRDRCEISFSPVKECAIKHNIKVLQYEKIRFEGAGDIRALAPDIMVTVAYGQIISQEILDIPKFGVINVHASLLPKYRGSSPIQQAILHCEKYTGITIMQTALGVDCGDIIAQKKIEILKGETSGELFDRLSFLGGDELLNALDLIEKGQAVFVHQDESQATHFPMLTKEDGHIDWSLTSEKILGHIAGMNPWPSAFSMLDGKLFKIWKAQEYDCQDLSNEIFDKASVGEIVKKENHCLVRAENGFVELLEVQAEGKKRMEIKAFLLGNKIENGVILN